MHGNGMLSLKIGTWKLNVGAVLILSTVQYSAPIGTVTRQVVVVKWESFSLAGWGPGYNSGQLPVSMSPTIVCFLDSFVKKKIVILERHPNSTNHILSTVDGLLPIVDDVQNRLQQLNSEHKVK